jgi:hypothetical protein
MIQALEQGEVDSGVNLVYSKLWENDDISRGQRQPQLASSTRSFEPRAQREKTKRTVSRREWKAETFKRKFDYLTGLS